MTQFKELPTGQRFKLKRWPKYEQIKIETIFTGSGHVRFNARYIDGGYTKHGHNAEVLLPPYGDTTGAGRQKTRYYDFKKKVLEAGWTSEAAFKTAVNTGVVDLPRKPSGGDNES